MLKKTKGNRKKLKDTEINLNESEGNLGLTRADQRSAGEFKGS
jgi:hypothetical protein